MIVGIRVVAVFSVVFFVVSCGGNDGRSAVSTQTPPPDIQVPSVSDDPAILMAMTDAQQCNPSMIPSVTDFSAIPGVEYRIDVVLSKHPQDINDPDAQFVLAQIEWDDHGLFVVYAKNGQSIDESVITFYTTPDDETSLQFALFRYSGDGQFCNTGYTSPRITVGGDQATTSISGNMVTSDNVDYFVIEVVVDLEHELHLCVIRNRREHETIMVDASRGIDSLPAGQHHVTFWVYNDSTEASGEMPVMEGDTFRIVGNHSGGCGDDLSIDELQVVSDSLTVQE